MTKDGVKTPLATLKITDVMPAEAISAAGKAVTISDDGPVVISSAAVEDKDVLTVLYRALM